MRAQAAPNYPSTSADGIAPDASVAMGEIRTGLLRHSAMLTRASTAQLLDLVPGEPLKESQRPIQHVLSPDVATGVDCQLMADGGQRSRAVGTVLTHAAVTSGRILQASTFTHVDTSGSGRRQQWPHYTAQPGRLETTGRVGSAKLAIGFAEQGGAPAPGYLDLGSVCERLTMRLQTSPLLDGRPSIKFQWTRLRWTALYAAKDDVSPPAATFALLDDVTRVMSLRVPYELRGIYRLDEVLELCRDLALHDWLLTTLTRWIERISSTSGDPSRVVGELFSTVSNLLHLWMPGARISTELEPVWQGFERRPGFTRQWQTAVEWIRDQLSLHTVRLLGTLADNQAPDRSARPSAAG